MKQVYTLKVSLTEDPKRFWRTIDVLSNFTVARVGYAILAAFEAEGSHLFSFNIKDTDYEFVYDDCAMLDIDVPPTSPDTVELPELGLSVGDHFNFVYDFGSDWEFDIEVVKIEDLEKGFSCLFPRITDGMGKGIIEDAIPFQLVEIADKNVEMDGPVEIISILTGEDEPEYEEYLDVIPYSIPKNNSALKRNILKLLHQYEDDDE